MSTPRRLLDLGARRFDRRSPGVLASSKLGVCEALEEALAEHASVSLVGEPGSGETCLLRALPARLPERGYRLTYCHNATLGRRDFYRQLCTAFVSESRQHPVFLLDEAHLPHQDTLAHLHILLNYEWDRRPLLSVVLVGLPELADRLSLRINRWLYSRLHHRLRIDPLTVEDSAAYLRLRLERNPSVKSVRNSSTPCCDVGRLRGVS